MTSIVKLVCLGKRSQIFNRRPVGRAKFPLEFIHAYLCGPISTVSKDGFNFVISFCNDFSGFVFTYFLKTKSDASAALDKFYSDCAQFGNVKRIRTDEGWGGGGGRGEYISKNFTSITNRCIKHEMTAPHSPHQNGTSERWWRICFDMGRCLLIDSNLPKQMWPYAISTATYIRNRCYQQRTKQTPYFMLTGKVPDISNLYVIPADPLLIPLNLFMMRLMISQRLLLFLKNVQPVVHEIDPQQNDVQLTEVRDGTRYPRYLIMIYRVIKY